jgi:hypothetical protein
MAGYHSGRVGGGKHFDDKAVTRWPVGWNFKREGQVVSLPEMSQWGRYVEAFSYGAPKKTGPDTSLIFLHFGFFHLLFASLRVIVVACEPRPRGEASHRHKST